MKRYREEEEEEQEQEEAAAEEEIEEIADDNEQGLAVEEEGVKRKCRGGFDMGSTNFSFSTAEIMSIKEIQTELYRGVSLPPGCFPMIGRPIDWRNIYLGPHEQDPCVDAMPKKLMSSSLAIREHRTRIVRIEQQNPNVNPVCAGLYCALRSFFRTLEVLSSEDCRHDIVAINPQKKFGYFGFRCPEGEKHRYERKQLSVDIVTLLFTMWVKMKFIDQRWLNVIKKSKKKDDLADSFLLMYADAAEQMYGEASFEACSYVIKYVASKKYFEKGSIELIAKFQTVVLRVERNLNATQRKNQQQQQQPSNKKAKLPPMKERRKAVDIEYAMRIANMNNSQRKINPKSVSDSTASSSSAAVFLDLTAEEEEEEEEQQQPQSEDVMLLPSRLVEEEGDIISLKAYAMSSSTKK